MISYSSEVSLPGLFKISSGMDIFPISCSAEAFAIKDFKTMQFLDWFIKEQGEEEKNAEDMIKKFQLYGHDAKGLYALNQELAARVYTPSTTGPAM